MMTMITIVPQSDEQAEDVRNKVNHIVECGGEMVPKHLRKQNHIIHNKQLVDCDVSDLLTQVLCHFM